MTMMMMIAGNEARDAGRRRQDENIVSIGLGTNPSLCAPPHAGDYRVMGPGPIEIHDNLAGRYAIVSEIGSGGMATVYLADDLEHRRKVAVKVLRPDLVAALGADRFEREIRIAAALNHGERAAPRRRRHDGRLRHRAHGG